MASDKRVIEVAEFLKSAGEVETLKHFDISAETLSRYLRQYRTIDKTFKDNLLDTNVKILLFDIETAPTKAYIWKRWKENISQDQVVNEGYILCYAAKWLGEDDVMLDALPFYTDYEADKENDKRVVESLYELFNEADLIIAHNGKAFDTPLTKSRFLYHGFMPPKPYKEVDTKLIAKSEFRFPSNSLDGLAAYLGLGRKTKNDGFPLWTGCMEGNKDAWRQMIDYNHDDTILLEKIYMKLRPWYRWHPAVDVYNKSGVMRCKCCGSTNLKEEDLVYTNISGFTSYQCQDCGHWNRGRQNQRSKEQMKTTLMNIL